MTIIVSGMEFNNDRKLEFKSKAVLPVVTELFQLENGMWFISCFAEN